MTRHAHPARRRLRRISCTLAVAAAVAVSSVTGLIPTPQGGEEAGAQVPAGTPGVSRYFGRGAFEGIQRAVHATPRSCALSDTELTALVLAPIFKEVSMAETPDAAPSPMTLSRWDEWTGRHSGSNNLHANYGLYAFRDPNTQYRRAYWTPGVGIFQYDVAGVGKPYTAAEMINVEFITRDVAGGMANRYCAAGGTAFNRRTAAWEPWSGLNGVAKSEALFLEMVASGRAPFANIGLVDGIENTGGVLHHTCLVAGVPTPCDYVDPAKAQGANWWATTNVDGGAVAEDEAPLPAPFYVIKRDGFEERHWLPVDTGYKYPVVARRRIGENARPRDGEPASGLQWYGATDLCDTERPELGCPLPTPDPAPAPAEPAAAPAAPTTSDDAMAQAWQALAELATVDADADAGADAGAPSDADAPAEQAEQDSASESRERAVRANSTFSFRRGLALLPPGAR